MISNSQNKVCIISFGLGMTTFSCSVGDEVAIYTSGSFSNTEFTLSQNETNDLVVNYYIMDNSTAFFYKNTTAKYVGLVNDKPMYLLKIENPYTLLLEDYIIYYNKIETQNHPPLENTNTNLYINNYVLTKGIYVTEAGGGSRWLPNSGVFSFANSEVLQLTKWKFVDNNFAIINIESIVKKSFTGGFKFPALNSKEIQVEMQNKNGTILKSNKINLIVNP